MVIGCNILEKSVYQPPNGFFKTSKEFLNLYPSFTRNTLTTQYFLCYTTQLQRGTNENKSQ